MRKSAILLVMAASLVAQAAEKKAKNVILFIADAGGVATVNLASAYGYGQPKKLFLQQMPNVALMDTSATADWVADSASGMSAIVTGQKTHNGVISQSATAVRGKSDGEILQTILEHAEQRGLSTGVLTNTSAADATPAACYAHSNSRGNTGEIFAQILKPRFGDGVDVVIGAGRKAIMAATQKIGINLETALPERGFTFVDSPDKITSDARKLVGLFDSGVYEPWPALERSIDLLSRNRKGFFLMVEWDTHTNDVKAGLDRMVALDNLIRQTAGKVKNDTLIVFTADHSFDIRLRGGRKTDPLIEPAPSARPKIRMDNGHTGEEVVVAAQGPGSGRVKGFILNSDLFQIMMAAYGWKK